MDFFDKIISFYEWLWKGEVSERSTSFDSIVLPKGRIGRPVRLDLYLPSDKNGVWSLLLLNDGQDGEQLNLKAAHEHFDRQHKSALMIVGIHAGNRMEEYGTAGQRSDKGLGKDSDAYQEFILKELLPYLHRNFPISAHPKRVGIAGFSLGGLSAMDMAWSWPKVFGTVGIFSGSLWWRDKPFDPAQPDANRVMQRRVELGELREQRIWCMAGTNDEKDDRNNNGIIDAIDDTLQLLSALKQKVHQPAQNLNYLEVKDGEHNQATWSKVFPDFIAWAYGGIK